MLLIKPGRQFVGSAGVIADQYLITLIAGALQDAVQATLQFRQVVLAVQQNRDHRSMSMAIVDLVSAGQCRIDFSLITTLAQMTGKRFLLVLIVFKLGRIADQYRLAQMRQTAHAALFDQAQQQVEFQRLGKLARITTRLDQQITTNQPVPSGQGRHTLQQIQVEARTEQRCEGAIGLTVNFIHRDRPALPGVNQLGAGQKQTAAGELFTRLRQHQPVAGRLFDDLIDLVDIVVFGDFDEVQGVTQSGGCRQVTGGEHHDLETPIMAVDQAVEGCLQLEHVGFQIKQQNTDLRTRWPTRQLRSQLFQLRRGRIT